MNLSERRDLLEPLLRERMRMIDDVTDVGNGTLLADAAATIAAHVAAAKWSGKGSVKERSSLLDDWDMQQILKAVSGIINHCEYPERTLQVARGMSISSGRSTGIVLGSVKYVLIRGRPGMHDRMESAGVYLDDRPGARRLKEIIALRMLDLPDMDVEKPAEDSIHVHQTHAHRDTLSLPLRSGPATTYLEDIVIQCAERMTDGEMEDVAGQCRERALRLWENRKLIDAKYAEAVDMFEKLVGRAVEKGANVKFAGVKVGELIHAKPGDQYIVKGMIEVLGNDLKPTTWTPETHNRPIEQVFDAQMAIQRKRQRILAKMDEDGARGRIDLVTVCAIRHYCEDPAATLRLIAKQKKVAIKTRKGKNLISLTWRNGQVGSSFEFNKDISWSYGTVIVKRMAFPVSVLRSLPGRSVSTLLDHAFFRSEDRIRSVQDNAWDSEYNRFNVDVGAVAFNAETGEILGD